MEQLENEILEKGFNKDILHRMKISFTICLN